MMQPTVAGQVAIVTGAARGIGAASALRLARDGMDVAVADLRADRRDALVNNAGIQRIAPPLDVTEDHWDAVMGVNAKARAVRKPRATRLGDHSRG